MNWLDSALIASILATVAWFGYWLEIWWFKSGEEKILAWLQCWNWSVLFAWVGVLAIGAWSLFLLVRWVAA